MGDSVLLESGDGRSDVGAAEGNGGVEATLGRALEQEAQEGLLLEFEDGPLEVDAAEGLLLESQALACKAIQPLPQNCDEAGKSLQIMK